MVLFEFHAARVTSRRDFDECLSGRCVLLFRYCFPRHLTCLFSSQYLMIGFTRAQLLAWTEESDTVGDQSCFMRSLNTILCGLLYRNSCRTLNASNCSFDRHLLPILNYPFSFALALLIASLEPSNWFESGRLCVSVVSVRVMPTGCSGRLNRTVAVTDV
jgi:hypothetical protein